MSKKKKKNRQKANSEIIKASQPKPSAQTEELSEKIVKIIGHHEFHGPIPPPGILKGYEEILPGAAERILNMAEKQAEHRRELEKKVVESDIALAKRGQFLALLVAIAGFITTSYLGHVGSHTAASVVGSATLVSIVSVFIMGKKSEKSEKAESKSPSNKP